MELHRDAPTGMKSGSYFVPNPYLEFEDLQLDHTQAQAFKLELQELLGRYIQQQGSHTYLFHSGLVLDPL